MRRGASRDLGHQVGADPLHDLVEGALHRGKRGQALDHAITPLNRVAALHRLAVMKHWPRGEITVAVGERLEQLGRKAVRQVVENVFAWRDVDLDIAPFFRRNPARRRSIRASPVETIWMTAAWPAS